MPPSMPGSPTRNANVLVPEFRFTVEESDIIDEDDNDGVLGPDAEAEQALAALAKVPDKRTKHDCEVLQRATAGVKFFKQMNHRWDIQ